LEEKGFENLSSNKVRCSKFRPVTRKRSNKRFLQFLIIDAKKEQRIFQSIDLTEYYKQLTIISQRMKGLNSFLAEQVKENEKKLMELLPTQV